jgi:biotin carboxyl carrier protein
MIRSTSRAVKGSPGHGTPDPGPRAVRVSLAAASASAGLDPLTVDPDQPGTIQLRRLDDERAVLDSGDLPKPAADGGSSSVLLLPPEPAEAPGVVRREVVIDGWRVLVEIEAAGRAALRERARRGSAEAAQSGPTSVRAIIPGVIVSVSMAAGDPVRAGEQILVVEAMKMQNELRAPRDGTIARIAVAPGQTIEVGDLLVVIS